jgi:uncharacterized membrane protein
VRREEFRPSTTRVEAFSDGVLAIILTLMIFDVKLPAGQLANLSAEFVKIAPHGVAYIASFLIVITFWGHHHQLFHVVAKMDRRMMWYNNVFLLFVSFIPFSTAFAGDYPTLPVAAFIYGFVLLLASLAGTLMSRYALRASLIDPRIDREHREQTVKRFFLAPISYTIAMGVAFIPVFGVWLSYFIDVAVLIAFMKPTPILLSEEIAES